MNIFIENKKLIGDIAKKYGCTLDVAKDRLKADLISGKDTNTGGLIPAELYETAKELGPNKIKEMNNEYFEHMKNAQDFGKPFDASDFN